MTKRIFRSIFIVASAVLALSFLIIMSVLYSHFSTLQKDTLRAQTALAAQGVEDGGDAYFVGLDASPYRLTWIAADGTVLRDTKANVAEMENHATRQEVAEALKTGSGESERVSSTFTEKTLYRAVRLTDGSVLRASVTQYTVLTLLIGMLQPVIIVLALAIILSAVLASRLAKRIVVPLNALDLEHPLENDSYEELSPLLTAIERQHRQITDQLSELQRRQDEFAAVTGSMNEGLVLLGSDGCILSVNNAALKLFGTDMGCVGRDILTIDRSLRMQHLVSEALNGKHSEAFAEQGGARYQLDSSPVMSDGAVTGVCILAFDVTEKTLAEERRREFTANVSHELKTPLQSIMGSAELMESGMVKSGDIPDFAGRIRSEAARLVALIEDIIRLSRLDEGEPLPFKDNDLYDIAQEAVESLASEAEARGVTVKTTGGSAHINGVRQLLWEIVVNLCGNAIKYNVPGGSVEVNVEPLDGGAVLSVTDTGVGIPKEDQSRVFERFYRVDKSRSKDTGGTGLGLSIVKHGAACHGASIELDSAPGAGTRITVKFPQNVSEQ